VGALNGLARVEQARGRYDRALPLFEEALDIYTAHRPADHPDIALVFNNIGVLYFHMGRVEEALDYLREALAIRESHYGLGNLDVALTSSNVGAVLIKLGEYSEALELTEQAISVMERILGDQAHGLGSAYNNLGFAQKELGDSEGAKQSLLRSLEIFEKEWGPDHPQIGPILHNLGTLYLHTSQGEEAIKYFERALELRRKISGTDRHPRSGLTRSNLGLLYTWRGDLERANQMLSEALEVQEEALGTDHPDIAHTLNNLGINLRMQGRPAEARPCMERSVAMWEGLLGPTHLYVGQGRLELSRALLDVGDLQSAWTQMVQSAAVVSANLEPNLAALSEGEAFLYLADMRERLELQLGLAARMDQIDLQVAAYENLLEWKGKIHRLMVAGMRSLRKADAAAPGGALQRLQSIQSETSSLIFGSTEDDPEQRRRRLRELREEREGLEDELHRLDPDRIDSKEVTVAKLLKALAPREAYLDFLVYQSYQPARFHEGTMTQVGDTGPAHLWVWITRADQDLVTLDLGPAGRVQEATQRFLQMLVSRRGAKPAVAEHEDGSEELRTLLWDPLRLHLEDIDRILVSPDDFLCTLPFETLQTAQGRFLLEERSFVYVSDVAAVVADHRVSPRKAALKSLLSVGAVDFRKREGSKGPGLSDVVGAQRGSFSMYWGSLPATRYESQVVLDMHEDAFGEEGRRVLLQEERATEERLKREMPRHRMLHLATHGFFQPEGLPSMWNQALSASRAPGPSVGQPEEARLVGLHPGLLSGLVCAGSNAELEAGRDDGYLTAEEVAWLDLSEVEVVVLSACDTGLGLSRTGEGLVGLRRAFHIAGAQTVISSLWSVQDDSTGELMQKFYRNLILRGMGRHESLRTAQLEILRRNRALNGDGRPSSWGAFVLSGQW
jgi:CHAT domain-containing protein